MYGAIEQKIFLLLLIYPEEIDLSDDNERQAFYKKVGEGISTVPQIYINDQRIGGFPQLVTWFEDNGF